MKKNRAKNEDVVSVADFSRWATEHGACYPWRAYLAARLGLTLEQLFAEIAEMPNDWMKSTRISDLEWCFLRWACNRKRAEVLQLLSPLRRSGGPGCNMNNSCDVGACVVDEYTIDPGHPKFVEVFTRMLINE